MEVQSTPSAYPMENKPAIILQQVCKKYDDYEVLHHVNMEIYPSEIIGYIGPNGAGKSTTVKILIGLINDFEGHAWVGGIDVRTQPLEVKKKIGYVPEVNELYDLLSPAEYLDFVGKLYLMEERRIEERSQHYLRLFGIYDNKDQRMDSFSKGMRQKVLLAAGLIHDPEIIILDEPLSGLDTNAVILVKQLLQSLKAEGKTIFYCSHMMDVVEKVSDRIILINKGTIIADGTVHSLQLSDQESLEQIFARLTNEPILTLNAAVDE